MRAYLIQRIFYVYSYLFDTVYPSYLVQWFIYKLTGKSELERLCLARNISYGLKIHSIGMLAMNFIFFAVGFE
jgi:hypothetical protein